ncbi:MAG TPA: serine hydrolase [Reyranella sp.]|nr:serine hydrolase [Reyranella sp.]
MMTRHLFDRRQAILGMGAALMMSAAKQAVAADGDFAARLAEMQRDGRVSGLDALLVSRRGRLLFEYYGEGEAENWGVPLGKVKFGPTVLHDLRSVSKSLVGMLYGIALAEGKVPPPEAGLYEQFPEYADLAKQPGRERITIAHVLSMTMGLEWDELTHPYGDPRNSENRMAAAPDRYRYILSLPIVEAPGVKWIYFGGATELLGRLIAKGTGQTLQDYARHALFDPLGLGPVEWSTDAKGEPRAASGGRMRPPDLLRVGQMVLANGAWQGKQIVPADWLKRSTTPAVTIEGARRYGWHWYLGELPVGTPRHVEPTISAIGWGGQRLFLVPALDLAVAMNAGNYRLPIMEQGRIGTALILDLVLPALS